jgi:hypothetical protein
MGPGALPGPSARSVADILDKRGRRCYMMSEAEAGGFPRFFQLGQLPGVRWQSGDAADCKSAYGGSIPPRTSRFFGGLAPSARFLRPAQYPQNDTRQRSQSSALRAPGFASTYRKQLVQDEVEQI